MALIISITITIISSLAIIPIFEIENPIHYIFLYLLNINIITIINYALDKYFAIKKNSYRISEDTLLSMMFLGGNLGALIARKFFHHKTIKKSFNQKFWIVIGLQLVVVITAFFCIESFNDYITDFFK